ncbi:MAG: hypothetical protein NG712_05995 [Omnitrophica bacterium]|nr:hypothetical protein [Candidatus Omnitrophota bacterium]
MKFKVQRSFLVLILLSAGLSGCVNLKAHSQRRNRLLATSESNLKGMGKVDLIKAFGHPLATSKSGVSECWHYAQPKAIWIWFKEDKVDHWEVE